jgi:probable rRNA maturation factor
MEILIDNRQKRIEIDQENLLKRARQILEDLGYSETAAISIALVDAVEMAELNMKYRGKEGPTNVLSFSQVEGLPLGDDPNLLGDVVICTDRAADDADALDYSHEEMTVYLLIHGILHLSGYDHDKPDQAQKMADKVETIFHQYYG